MGEYVALGRSCKRIGYWVSRTRGTGNQSGQVIGDTWYVMGEEKEQPIQLLFQVTLALQLALLLGIYRRMRGIFLTMYDHDHVE